MDDLLLFYQKYYTFILNSIKRRVAKGDLEYSKYKDNIIEIEKKITEIEIKLASIE